MAVQRKNQKRINSARLSNILRVVVDKKNEAARQAREEVVGIAREDEAHRSNRGNRGGNLGNNS